MNKNQTQIIQPWTLTKARYSFSIYEDRIFRTIIANLQDMMAYDDEKNFDDDFEMEIKIKDIIQDNNHSRIAFAVKRLREKTITFYREKYKDFVFTGLIMEAIYSEQNQYIIIRISKHLMPYLTFFNKSFTKYNLNICKKFRSPYTVRMYEYICHMINGKKPIYKTSLLLESLRKRLGIENKYNRAISVKKNILEPAIKELNKAGDVSFTIKENIKIGRKIVGWKIDIFKEEQKLQKPLIPPPSKKTNTPPSKENEKLFTRLCGQFKLSQLQAIKVVKSIDKIDKKELEKTLYAIKTPKNPIANIGGFTVKVLNKKFGLRL